MDAVEALLLLGGVAPWARLRALNVTPYSLRQQLGAGHVLRLRRGVHALPGADPALTGAVRLGGVLSCASAAAVYDLPLLSSPTAPHVTVPRSWSKAFAPGIVVHRRDVDADDTLGGVSTVEQVVLDTARELPFPEAVVIADAALNRGACADTIRGKVADLRGRGSPQARRVLGATDGRAESAIETILRLLARPLGLVELQVGIRGVGRVDLLVDGWLVLEADGFAHHSDRAAYREDRRRANTLATCGYVLLRFTYEDILFRQDDVVATIRQVLRGGPCPGFTPRPT